MPRRRSESGVANSGKKLKKTKKALKDAQKHVGGLEGLLGKMKAKAAAARR